MLTFDPGPTNVYFLPEDVTKAREDFLSLLHNGSETYVVAYAFEVGALVDELLTAHGSGVKLHLYLDRSTRMGRIPFGLVQKMTNAGIEVTLGTAMSNIGYVGHTKGLVTATFECWQGSIDFSDAGWRWVELAHGFVSQQWTVKFINSFGLLRRWAWKLEAETQVMAEPPVGV